MSIEINLIIMSLNEIGMLSSACSKMPKSTFDRLPSSTNAVESHNRLCKGSTPDSLNVAMMATYKLDMAATLQHLAATEGVSTSYECQTPEARSRRASAQNKARNKRQYDEINDAEGPPDKKYNFGKFHHCKLVTETFMAKSECTTFKYVCYTC